MEKFKSIMWLILATGIVYAVITLFMPAIRDAIAVTDAELLVAVDNVTRDFPGAKESLDYMPWLLYLIPGFIIVIAAIVILKRQDAQ